MSIRSFIELVEAHTFYRKEGINLVASENCSSPLVRSMLASDLVNRYSADFYGGTTFIQKIITKTESLVRELFDADFTNISPLSGNLCDLTLIYGLTKQNNKIMLVNSGENGGYPLDIDFFGRKKITFSYSIKDMNILINENIEAIKKLKPSLVIFGSSFIPFPHPIKEITSEFINQKSITFAYDGSHVLGLIAGKQFQDPLREGCSVLVGSTHKSFPGPQGGLIVTNDMNQNDLFSSILDLNLEKGIRLVDNKHPNRIAALGIATLEMIEFGQAYAQQIVKNSKALAKALYENGVPVKFKHLDYTESHQIILESINYEHSIEIRDRAAKIGLFFDAGIRLGTSEVTRMGMSELEMKEIADIIARVYFDDISSEISRRVKDLARIFSKPMYCFNDFTQVVI
ncbi:MAG: hypothetical protein JXA54_11990 [Candidatus Heimdallarchaeota archaeon]|nr:hypothetical protein [Candidatus Heimdallarchaeota archaeon]